jgi:hypothetical protein
VSEEDDLRGASANEPVVQAITRAFASAPELAPSPDDDARIAAAVQRTLAVTAPAATGTQRYCARFRTVAYLSAATLVLGALAVAASHRGTGTVASTSAPAQRLTSTVATAPLAPTSPVTGAGPLAPATAAAPAITPDSLPSAAPALGAAPHASGSARARTQDPATPGAAPSSVTAAELFARANEARSSNEIARAVALHRELQTRFADSREASTSRVGLGRLLLDRANEPLAARAAFESYLAHDPAGPLAEEACAGRALASMRLGDANGERAAWTELLDRHPASVHADRARQRLAVLRDGD